MLIHRDKKDEFIETNLQRLLESVPRMDLGKRRLVVFSDLHMGSGNSKDDFLPNAEMFSRVCGEYYLKEGYELFLNGDIEELQRFSYSAIRGRWSDLYGLFGRFAEKTSIYKTVGNHDVVLSEEKEIFPSVEQGYIFHYGDESRKIFIFHGHQASLFFQKYNHISGIALRYLANPLRIKNYSVAHDSDKKIKTERRVYNFSVKNKVLSIIGHTHRPLFESLSKVDSLRYRIEELCRKHPGRSEEERRDIEKEILEKKGELQHLYSNDRLLGTRSSLYNTDIVIPSLFNSGCVIGKRGMTSIEIDGDEIRLVHWFDKNKTEHYSTRECLRVGNSSVFRKVLKKDNLGYIFTRINLLA